MSTSEESARQKERRVTITKYVEEHPYPSYEDMSATLMEENMWLYAEYGQCNHDCCKTVYENPLNEDLCAEMGKRVYSMGGITGLRALHSIVVFYSPYKDSHHDVIQSQGKMLELYFMKSCDEWVA